MPMTPFARLISGNPAAALAFGGGAIGAVGAGIAGVLILAGVPSVQAPQQAPPAAEQAPAPVAAWQDSPASQALAQALSKAPDGWSKDGDTQRAVTPPFPYSCPQPGTAPAVSLAQAYNVSGARVQVVVQAYTAGAGADAMTRQLGNVGVCSGSDGSAYVTTTSSPAPGIESHQANTNRGGIKATVISSRRGDVLTHVIGTPGAPVQALSVAFDTVLERALQGKCLQEDSKASDASRSPWSAAGYKPYTAPQKVSIAAAKLPDIPSGTTATRTELPAKVPEITEVAPLPKPSYPVWPAMPDHMDLPVAPDAPDPKAPTEASIDVPSADQGGPGCGWAFTGMKAPAFDTAAAEKTRTELTLTAITKLNDQAKTWQTSVLDYWVKLAAFDKAANAYKDYAKAVTDANTAWAATGKLWDTYNQNLASYQKQVKARADFQDRKKAAAADFDKAVAACSAPQPTPSPSPSPTPSPTSTGPSDGSAPVASPQPSPTTQAPKSGCPAKRPAILDQAVPEVETEPTPPADPRPKS